jgi:methylated-DNA-[protein]-cysteine S-methyltransferase
MPDSNNQTTWYQSPAGWIEITAGPEGISSLNFREPGTGIPRPEGLLAECISQLELYFRGNLKKFSLPLAPAGTPFQLQVWAELLKVPYGQVITYRDLAIRFRGPTYTRMVGQANSRNPVSILIPCHRVIGMNGALTGYAGGLWRKKFLLELEQKGSHTDFNPTLFGNNPG